LEIARGLGEAGAAVAIVARRAEWLDSAVDELRGGGIRVRGDLCDVTDADQLASAVAGFEAELGTIDILVNCAGISWGAPAETMPLDRWRAVLDTNVTGTFVCCQAVGRGMLDRQRGSIVNVASIAGLVGQDPTMMDAVGYTASKGAVVALTRDLAVKWAARGVRVNAIAPGFFPTRMTKGVLDAAGARIAAANPMGRLGGADELKGAVVFLASDAASYVTGHVLAVDGGHTAW
jgi:gluconate 5-dehydrogenase